MKKSILILSVLALTMACSEEELFVEPNGEVGRVVEIVEEQKTSESIFMVVEEQAKFPGGQEAWAKFLNENLTYPEEAQQAGIEGAVFLSFVVDTDGSIDDVVVTRAVGGGCDEAAVKALLESPNWIPAKQRGRDVKARMAIRMVFRNGTGTTKTLSPNNEIVFEKSSRVTHGGSPYVKVDKQATFTKGDAGWGKYLSENLHYPEEALKTGVEGSVVLSFVVEENGEIKDINVMRSIGAGCDEEAIRVLKSSPRWTPAQLSGENVASRTALRIVFQSKG